MNEMDMEGEDGGSEFFTYLGLAALAVGGYLIWRHTKTSHPMPIFLPRTHVGAEDKWPTWMIVARLGAPILTLDGHVTGDSLAFGIRLQGRPVGSDLIEIGPFVDGRVLGSLTGRVISRGMLDLLPY